MREKPGKNFIPLVMGLVLVGGVLASGWWWRDSLLSFVEKAEEPAPRHDPHQPPPEVATVKTVLDSITVELDTGHIVRYIGVRTPGVAGEIQCFGKEALLANESVIGKEVRLEEEPLLTRAQDGAWTRYVFLLPEEAESNVQAPNPNSQINSNNQGPNNDNETFENSDIENSLKIDGLEIENSNEPTPTTGVTVNNETEDEVFINERILEGGFGFPVVSQDMKYGERLLSAARFASATGKGLWSRCEVTGESPHLVTQAETDCLIKGKVTSDFKKIYRTPECSAYSQTTVLESQGGRWFCAEDIAQDAGFAKAPDCP